MGRIPAEFIDALMDKVDIVDVVSEYVSLKKQGNKYLGLCPFHNEKTASFTVDGDKQLFYCFGCHAGGNLIGFLEKKENLSFYETIEELAKRANVPMPVTDDNNRTPFYSKETRSQIYEANKEAARFYHGMLFEPEGTEGLEYLTWRGLTQQIIRRFGLGYAPDSRDSLIKHLKEKGFTEEIIVSAGLARQNEYGLRDNFRTRVMFPIIAPGGEILGFGGRVLDHSQPKYLNTGDTPVFNKRKNLYALNLLRKNNRTRAIIGEGYMDVIALNQAGFDYGVASLGTAVTPEQVRLLKRYVKEIYVCYDGDTAGISATHKVIDLMHAEGLKPRIISLPVGVDPDEYIKGYGAESFTEMMKTARTSIEYLVDEVREQCDMTVEAGRAEFAQKATKIVETYAFDAIETEMYLKRINQLSGFSMDALYNNMDTVPDKKPVDSAPGVAFGVLKRFDSVTERALISVLIEHPDLLPEAEQKLNEDAFVNPAYKKIYETIRQNRESVSLKNLMRLMEEDEDCTAALSAVGIESTVFGDASAYLKDCCLKMNVESLTRQRDERKQALSGPGDPMEKIKIAGEIAALDKKIKQLRSEF